MRADDSRYVLVYDLEWDDPRQLSPGWDLPTATREPGPLCSQGEEMTQNSSRRRFLKTTATLGAARSVLATPGPALPDANIYTRLGIRPVINGVGVVTVLGGSIMPPEVVRAMEESSKHFVPLLELQKKVGARIAALLGIEAAMVTAGCASAITVATAACVAN